MTAQTPAEDLLDDLEDDGPAAAGPLWVTLPADARPDRLDRALAALLPDLSRTRLKALIQEGAVATRDGPLFDPSAKALPGQSFAIILGDPTVGEPEPEFIPLDVLYEDSDLIVIDKPAGMVVHPAPGNATGTLVNALLGHCGASLAGIGGVARPGIVHRLDKDTSGLMVAAKNDASHRALCRQFAERSIDRAYVAIAWGRPNPASGELSGSIGRDPRERKRMAVTAAGKPALTRYKLIQSYADGAASRVECRLASGRTHQIRVHMTHLGHPLIGDPLYGRAPRRLDGPAWEAVRRFPRQALHAALLGFTHPNDGTALRFERAPPQDMAELTRLLEAL
jgi:23S rRNA pseudouridine1911/1915/1917 synthase